MVDMGIPLGRGIGRKARSPLRVNFGVSGLQDRKSLNWAGRSIVLGKGSLEFRLYTNTVNELS